MDFQITHRLYGQIETTRLVGHKRDLLIAVRYARLRTDWQLADMDQRREMERHRAAAHDALIDACNIIQGGVSIADPGDPGDFEYLLFQCRQRRRRE